ncbi:MAG: hypothetical protein ABIV47_20805 [Roseiflexaceae bacterium]
MKSNHYTAEQIIVIAGTRSLTVARGTEQVKVEVMLGERPGVTQ